MAPTIRILALTALLSLPTGAPSHADQSDPALPQLFAELRTAPDTQTARGLEAQIWTLWLQTKDPTAAQLMEEGTEHLAAGDAQGAMSFFDQLVTLAPDFAEAWNKRATALYLLGRYQDSIADIDHVLTLEPHHFGALSGLAMCQQQRGQTRAALEALRRAQTIDPNLTDIVRSIDALKKQLDRESI